LRKVDQQFFGVLSQLVLNEIGAFNRYARLVEHGVREPEN
jgi:hypothetical protein